MKKVFTSASTWKWAGMFLVSIAVIFLALHFQHRLSHFRSLGLLGIFLINFLSSATIFLPAPGIATVVAGGAIYSPIAVGLVAALGATLGDMISYMLGVSSKEVFLKNHNPWSHKLTKLFEQFGGWMVFIFALIPNPVFDAVGIIAGALGYPWYKYFIWLFLGRLIRDVLLAFLGWSTGF